MLIAFQVILLLIISLSFVAFYGEKNEKRQENMMFVTIMAIVAFLVTVIWL